MTVERPATTAAVAPRRATALLVPKTLIAGLITLILVVGEWRFHILGGYDRLALALGLSILAEIGFSFLLVGRFPQVLSAYITGNSLAILLKPAGGMLWPFSVGAGLSIASKYTLRWRGRHLWNPSNFGISVLLLLAPSQVAILSHEWGNALHVNAVIWAFGLWVVWRARLLHVTAAYVVAFLVLAAARSAITGTPLAAEVGPLTGPMYQLLAFFMLTDPRTTVGSRKGRILVVVLVAVVEALIRLGNDFHLAIAAPFAPAPPILALFLVGPIAMIVDLERRARASEPASGVTLSRDSGGKA